MSRTDAELAELLAEWGSQEPPPLEPGQADAMVAEALAALDDTLGVVPPPAPEPEPANTHRSWWLRAAVPLAAAAALIALGWQLAQQQQPTQPETMFAEQQAPSEPSILVIEGKPGLELAVRDEQPVLLRMGPHELELTGTGRLTIESIEHPTLRVQRGTILAHWKGKQSVPLRLATTHGDIALEQGKGRITVTDDALTWQLDEGAAHRIDAPEGTSAAPIDVAPPPRAPTPVERTAPQPEPAEGFASDEPTPAEAEPEGISEADAAEALYVRAEAALAAGHDQQAIALLEQLVSEFSHLPAAATALADLSLRTRETDPERSRAYDRQLVRDYPGSFPAAEARQRLNAAN